MYILKQIASILGALVALQATGSLAQPTGAGAASKTLASRDLSDPQLKQLFGQTGRAENEDIVTALGYLHSRNTTAKKINEIDLYLKTLSAIVELNPDWVGTLFASEEETKDLRKAKEGEIYVMRYIKEESKRTPVAVQSDWIVEGPLSEPLYGTGVPTPSSPWALLQASINTHADQDLQNPYLDIDNIIYALTASKMIHLNLSDSNGELQDLDEEERKPDRLWDDYFTQPGTPVWIKLNAQPWVVSKALSEGEHGKNNRRILISLATQYAVWTDEVHINKMTNLETVSYLEGFPRFDGPRKDVP